VQEEPSGDWHEAPRGHGVQVPDGCAPMMVGSLQRRDRGKVGAAVAAWSAAVVVPRCVGEMGEREERPWQPGGRLPPRPRNSHTPCEEQSWVFKLSTSLRTMEWIHTTLWIA
jgi:hypothetical protein